MLPVEAEAQVAQFMNEVYRYEEPKNIEIHRKQVLSTKSIYSTINEYTTVFKNRTPQ